MRRYCTPHERKCDKISQEIKAISITVLYPNCTLKVIIRYFPSAKENLNITQIIYSQHFATPLVSPLNSVWETSAEIAYSDPCSASNWMKQILKQSEALPRSGQWHVISMKFLRLFFRLYFPWETSSGAPRNVGCFYNICYPSWYFILRLRRYYIFRQMFLFDCCISRQISLVTWK